ncbi:hypothetical protein, partial [Bradyrhizobium niftali]|uniref:hypothetical protein n=1 Tax=Bradyrhizobium niftali TaxID=2560055 RepID=UPI001F48BBAF
QGSLGILNLERGPAPAAPRLGSILNPTTFDFPVISETVAGAWAENVIRGEPALESACIAAARRLVQRGAVAISSNCGFFMRHQAAVSASVRVPVVLSSLLVLPALLRQVAPGAKVAIVTADSKHCDEELLGVSDRAERARLVIGGLEGGKLWHNELQRPPPYTETADIQADTIACVTRLRQSYPDIVAILLECTALPAVAPEVRRLTKLPVYDITDLCRLTMASIAQDGVL